MLIRLRLYRLLNGQQCWCVNLFELLLEPPKTHQFFRSRLFVPLCFEKAECALK